MNHLEFIKSRRSYRKYKNTKVDKKLLDEIVYCGLVAPSGMNTQGIHISVVTDENLLNRINETVGRNCTYSAPALLVVHCEKDYRYAYTDGSCTMANMYLAAEALELGSCWINQLKDISNSEVKKEMGLDNQIIVGSLAVGYKDEEKTPRNLNLDRVHYF